MPNPMFQPVIGSGFGDIAQQQQFWSGFNNRVDENNFGRLAEAQRTRNAWLAQVAKMQQDEAARQDAAQRQTTELALGQQADAENRRRFEIDLGLRREDQSIKKADIAEKTQHWNFNLAERNKEEKKFLDQADNFGKAKGSETMDLGKKLDDAEQGIKDAKVGLDKAISQIANRYPGVVWDNRAKRFGPGGYGKTVSQEKLQAANSDFDEAKSEADRASIEYSAAHEAFLNLHKDASPYGLTPVRRGGRWVLYSSAHDKYYPDSSNADQPFESDFGSSTSGAADAMRNPAPYAGFGGGTSTGTGSVGNLTPDIARQFLQQAGGDKEKARQMARDAGYTF